MLIGFSEKHFCLKVNLFTSRVCKLTVHCQKVRGSSAVELNNVIGREKNEAEALEIIC